MGLKKGQCNNLLGRPKTEDTLKSPIMTRYEELKQKLEEHQFDPVDFLIRIAKDEQHDVRVRVQAGRSILDKYHPDLKAIDIKSDDRVDKDISEIKVKMDELIEKHIKDY